MPTKRAKSTATKSAKATSTVNALAAISAEEFEQASEKLSGQERSAQLQLKTRKVEGVLLKSDEQQVKNDALADRVNHASEVRNVQAQTLAQRLQQERDSLTFTTSETAMKQDAHSIALEGYTARNEFGRQMLSTQKSMYAAKLQAAKANVQNFIAAAQSEAQQLAGQVIDV